MPPGTGAIDWKDVFNAFRDSGYQRTLMLELTDALTAPREYDQDREIRTGLANVRRLAGV
jgi:sugar phosphate isomerase/epimerase